MASQPRGSRAAVLEAATLATGPCYPELMARKTLICVDTYVPGQRGQLAIGDHREFRTADEALRRAEYAVGKASVVGALAYTIEADHEFEDYSEPVVLGRFGTTPDA